MESWLLGFCIHSPDGTRPGRIEVLASLKKGTDGALVMDQPAQNLHDEIGPSVTVFWPQSPPSPQELHGCLVRFRCAPGPEYGEATTSKDWMRVQKTDSNKWDVHRVGYRVAEEGPDIQWRQDPRWVRGLNEGEGVFIHQRATSKFIGPWRVGHELSDVALARELIPNHNNVFQYEVKNLSKYIWTYKQSQFLLYAPDQAKGEPLDLATPKQLAKWLVDRMLAVAPQAVARFDREVPGWRTKVRDEIEAMREPERKLFRSRWERLANSLDDLVFETESVNRLLEQPTFLARVDELVRLQVAQLVAVRASEIETEAKQRAKVSVERLELEILDIEKQRDEMLRDVESRLDELARRERSVNELGTHLVESRERLLRDFTVYQSLLPAIVRQPIDVPQEPKAVCNATAEGLPVSDAMPFIDTRLWPCLDHWFPGVPRSMSVVLHGAACGSRAVIVPNPAWARAYADALGPFARFSVVNVQPTWLGFEDLWRGGLGPCWERASRDGSTIEIVLLRDFNRALPQCYARPLLDLVAGYCDALPEPGSGCWPNNLRVFACPSPPDEALPLTAEIVQHFASVQKSPARPTTDRAPALASGYVPVETWFTWSTPRRATEADMDLTKEYGSLACSAATDIATISEILCALGMNEREAKQTAHEIRVTEPVEYLGQLSSEGGGT